MGLPAPNWEVVFAAFIAAVFFACALALMVWVAMDWYEERDR